jgi:hypothetical protein
MINTTLERTFPLAKAARKYASARGSGTVHPSTLHRWRSPGINGIALECLKVGGVWHTSEEALQRFFERLTAAQAPEGEGASASAPPEKPANSGSALSRNDRVESELAAILHPKQARS